MTAMIDVTTNSQSQPSTSRPRTRRVATRPNLSESEPTLAFGFVLDHACRLRWATHFIEEYQNDTACTFIPQERERRLSCMSVAIVTAIPNRIIYHALLDVPRVRKDLLPVEHPKFGFDDFVFVLWDNSTVERLPSPLTPEHIKAVRKTCWVSPTTGSPSG